ncbi:MAG: 50S ribosomal protein L23 [Verrucomicrobiota bacterium]|nr:50S ribosomal protein L23 [Verrucomicrobiota bacterium]
MIQDHKILIRHIITEKAAKGSSDFNQYTFEVISTANRVQIGQAIEKALGKKVAKVRIINVKPKAKPSRIQRGRMALAPGYKKAIISLKAGESIEIA